MSPFAQYSFSPDVEQVLDEGETQAEAEARMKEVWASATAWEEGERKVVGGRDNELAAVNPIVNVCQRQLEKMMARFYRQECTIELE